MGRRKQEPLSENKKNIITGLLQEYDIKTTKDIEDTLKDLLNVRSSRCLKQKWTRILDIRNMSDQTILTIATVKRSRRNVRISSKPR